MKLFTNFTSIPFDYLLTSFQESNELNESKIAGELCSGSRLFGVKTGSMLVCRPCDRTSENLNKTNVR